MTGSTQSPDLDLAKRSERAAVFEAAVLSHLDAAYTLARYLTRRSDIADDIVQDAILRAFRGYDGLRGDNVRAWLLAIVRNCFLTWNAKEGMVTEVTDAEESQSHISPGYAGGEGKTLETPESILIGQQQNEAIRSLIERIPHPYRETLVLRDIEDLTYRDIAEITGVPMGTVMSRLARARKLFAVAWHGSEMTTAMGRLP
jgi:RNA polymerase sigma factor (sigma-70 family)